MGPCTANARRPTVVSRCRGTTISCCVADLRCCLPTTSVTGVPQYHVDYCPRGTAAMAPQHRAATRHSVANVVSAMLTAELMRLNTNLYSAGTSQFVILFLSADVCR